MRKNKTTLDTFTQIRKHQLQEIVNNIRKCQSSKDKNNVWKVLNHLQFLQISERVSKKSCQHFKLNQDSCNSKNIPIKLRLLELCKTYMPTIGQEIKINILFCQAMIYRKMGNLIKSLKILRIAYKHHQKTKNKQCIGYEVAIWLCQLTNNAQQFQTIIQTLLNELQMLRKTKKWQENNNNKKANYQKDYTIRYQSSIHKNPSLIIKLLLYWVYQLIQNKNSLINRNPKQYENKQIYLQKNIQQQHPQINLQRVMNIIQRSQQRKFQPQMMINNDTNQYLCQNSFRQFDNIKYQISKENRNRNKKNKFDRNKFKKSLNDKKQLFNQKNQSIDEIQTLQLKNTNEKESIFSDFQQNNALMNSIQSQYNIQEEKDDKVSIIVQRQKLWLLNENLQENQEERQWDYISIQRQKTDRNVSLNIQQINQYKRVNIGQNNNQNAKFIGGKKEIHGEQEKINYINDVLKRDLSYLKNQQKQIISNQSLFMKNCEQNEKQFMINSQIENKLLKQIIYNYYNKISQDVTNEIKLKEQINILIQQKSDNYGIEDQIQQKQQNLQIIKQNQNNNKYHKFIKLSCLQIFNNKFNNVVKQIKIEIDQNLQIINSNFQVINQNSNIIQIQIDLLPQKQNLQNIQLIIQPQNINHLEYLKQIDIKIISNLWIRCQNISIIYQTIRNISLQLDYILYFRKNKPSKKLNNYDCLLYRKDNINKSMALEWCIDELNEIQVLKIRKSLQVIITAFTRYNNHTQLLQWNNFSHENIIQLLNLLK